MLLVVQEIFRRFSAEEGLGEVVTQVIILIVPMKTSKIEGASRFLRKKEALKQTHDTNS
jgi:hypothetical protein